MKGLSIIPPKPKKKTTTELAVIAKMGICSSCGAEINAENGFYMSKYSPLYKSNGHRVTFCKTCTSELFANAMQAYGDEKIALLIMCHYFDIPYVEALYESIKTKKDNFNIGLYLRSIMNNLQYDGWTFVDTLLSQERTMTQKELEQQKETKWTYEDMNNKRKVVDVVGYDPFEGFPEKARRFCFNDLLRYLGEDDDLSQDNFKLSAIVQIVKNNEQINNYDLRISGLDPVRDADTIKVLNQLKTTLVTANDKIAKENEISVKNRSNKDVGKNTLAGLMKRMRELDFDDIEANYYDQLMGAGTRWAVEMSQKAIMENGLFDEADRQEIFAKQREMIRSLTEERDKLKEENRLLKIDYKWGKKKEVVESPPADMDGDGYGE